MLEMNNVHPAGLHFIVIMIGECMFTLVLYIYITIFLQMVRWRAVQIPIIVIQCTQQKKYLRNKVVRSYLHAKTFYEI